MSGEALVVVAAVLTFWGKLATVAMEVTQEEEAELEEVEPPSAQEVMVVVAKPGFSRIRHWGLLR